MAPCFIFLGAKVEEQPRKLEHVLKVAHKFLHKDSETQLDMHSDVRLENSLRPIMNPLGKPLKFGFTHRLVKIL